MILTFRRFVLLFYWFFSTKAHLTWFPRTKVQCPSMAAAFSSISFFLPAFELMLAPLVISSGDPGMMASKAFLPYSKYGCRSSSDRKKEIPHQLIGSPAIYRVLNIRGGLELLQSTAWFMIIVFSHAKQSDRLLSPMWCITWRAGPWFSMAKWCGKQHVFQVSLWLSCNLPGMYKSAFLLK